MRVYAPTPPCTHLEVDVEMALVHHFYLRTAWQVDESNSGRLFVDVLTAGTRRTHRLHFHVLTIQCHLRL